MVCFQFFFCSNESIFTKYKGVIFLQIWISWTSAEIAMNGKCTLWITSILGQTWLFFWIERKFLLNELVCPNAVVISENICGAKKKFFSNFGNEFESAWKTDSAINSFSWGWKTYVFDVQIGQWIANCAMCSVQCFMLLFQLKSNLKFHNFRHSQPGSNVRSIEISTKK